MPEAAATWSPAPDLVQRLARTRFHDVRHFARVDSTNRYLLTDKETGVMTPRGQAILSHTPLGRYGKPEDLVGSVLWLMSPLSEFVTGVVIPIDGGFSAYAGV